MRISENRFPPGWDEDRVRIVLEHYEQQTESEATAEDEASFEVQDQTIMKVPTNLVARVRELIGTHQT